MVTSKTQAQAPARSLDQRMEALKRANDIRVRRAQLKKDLKDGRVSDRGDPARPAGVRLDREGVRHADGGAEVRARQGGPVPQPVPDQPVEDGRRPLRAPARRADWPLQPAVRTEPDAGLRAVARLRGHRPLGGRQGDADQAARSTRVPELELAVSATTRPQRPGEEDGREYWFLSEDEFARRVDAGEFLEHVQLRVGASLRDAPLRARPDRGRRPRRVLELEIEGALRVQEEVPGSVTIFIARRLAELERRLRDAGDRELGRDRRADRARAAGSSSRRTLPLRGRNDDVERADRRARGDRRTGAGSSQLPWPGR